MGCSWRITPFFFVCRRRAKTEELITNGVFKGIGGVGKEHGHGIS